MRTSLARLFIAATVVVVTTGCASYRTDSNIPSAPPGTAVPAAATKPVTTVLISEDALPKRKFKEIGSIEVSVKKLTIFHKDPTKEQANEALTEKAREIGADAVIKVVYKSGIGFTTWGYIDANGMGVKLAD